MDTTTKSVRITSEVDFAVYSEVPAWDESYTALPGEYPTVKTEYFPGRPFMMVTVPARVRSAKKFALWCGNPVGQGKGPDFGDIVSVSIPVHKLPTNDLIQLVK